MFTVKFHSKCDRRGIIYEVVRITGDIVSTL